jgi:hypothetical protein
MEGYRISREASDAIIRGEPLSEGPQDVKSLQAAMAVQGYSIAFSEVLEQSREKAPIDTKSDPRRHCGRRTVYTSVDGC